MVTPIRARGLTRRFRDVLAVNPLDLDVEHGEAFGLLGRNGAGKTTIVHLLAGLLAPTAGTAEIAGASTTDPAFPGPARVGLVSGVAAAAEPTWSPARYVRHFADVAGLDRSEAVRRAKELFDALDLGEHAERRMGKLSAGTLRKVEIARALVPRPRVLLLDEPTRELDLVAKDAVWELLSELRRGGATIFLASHDSHEIERVASRVGVLARGKLAWTGAPSELAGSAALSSALRARLEFA